MRGIIHWVGRVTTTQGKHTCIRPGKVRQDLPVENALRGGRVNRDEPQILCTHMKHSIKEHTHAATLHMRTSAAPKFFLSTSSPLFFARCSLNEFRIISRIAFDAAASSEPLLVLKIDRGEKVCYSSTLGFLRRRHT